MNEFWTGVITTLACMGGTWLGLQCYNHVMERWNWHKLHKSRKLRQKERLKMYETGDRRPAPIKIKGTWLGLQCYNHVMERWNWHKLHKSRKLRQKERLKMYETGDRRPASILIAQEYAAELKTKEQPRLLKATGLFSDETAQALLR